MKTRSDKKRSESIIIIANLVLSIIAIAFMIGLETPLINAEDGFETEKINFGIEENGNPPPNPIPPGQENYGHLAKWFEVEGKVGGNLLQGVEWAAISYFTIGFLAPLLGLSDSTTKALQASVSAGLFTYQAVEAFQPVAVAGKSTFLTGGSFPTIAGIGVGVAVFVLTYKKEKYETINFSCLPWEAPIGGNDCEKCNDENHICSEYRCKSLGQACELVNKGTDKETCVWINPRDVLSPTITPLNDAITSGYRYTETNTRPPSWGTRVVRTTSQDGCVAAFTPIEFGIQTNKPAQCKIDFSINSSVKFTKAYDEMNYYFGESNLFSYNHTQRMNIPGPQAVNSEASSLSNNTGGLVIQNDGRYELYVRCKSANGFFNQDPFVIKFCVDKGPDVTAPRIEETNIRNNQPVQFEVDKVPIIVYTNEPSTCKWSRTNQEFNNMENNMTCANSISQMESNLLYACAGDLTSIKDKSDNLFYFRCEDQPWKPKTDRNVMTTSYEFHLKGTEPLNIKKGSIKPYNETVTSATTTVNITLQLETEHGYKDGEAECSYSLGNTDNFIPFANTNSYVHRQNQDLVAGTYTYYFRCVDLGGNTDTGNTTFTVKIDTQPPQVVRVLFDSDRLKILTDEDAECIYSTNSVTGCNYNFNDANAKTMLHETPNKKTEHLAPWELGQTYFIKCEDVNNKQPSPTQCSIIVRPVDIV